MTVKSIFSYVFFQQVAPGPSPGAWRGDLFDEGVVISSGKKVVKVVHRSAGCFTDRE